MTTVYAECLRKSRTSIVSDSGRELQAVRMYRAVRDVNHCLSSTDDDIGFSSVYCWWRLLQDAKQPRQKLSRSLNTLYVVVR
jgi:hypothetical protein